jgi:hypothetical protein
MSVSMPDQELQCLNRYWRDGKDVCTDITFQKVISAIPSLLSV